MNVLSFVIERLHNLNFEFLYATTDGGGLDWCDFRVVLFRVYLPVDNIPRHILYLFHKIVRQHYLTLRVIYHCLRGTGTRRSHNKEGMATKECCKGTALEAWRKILRLLD